MDFDQFRAIQHESNLITDAEDPHMDEFQILAWDKSARD